MVSKSYRKLNVRPDTFNLVMVECVEEFLKYNPSFEGMNITQEYIVKRIAKKYLGRL